jgi:hypothetical protein
MFLRSHILKQDPNITESWKYGMPFYCYKKKMFCYLWVHKKYRQPYIGIVEGKKINHTELILEKRARMKIFLVDPKLSIPVKKIDSILKEILALYK